MSFTFIFLYFTYLEISKVFLMIHKNNNSTFLLPSMSCIFCHHPFHSAIYRRHNTWINVYLNIVFGEVGKSSISFFVLEPTCQKMFNHVISESGINIIAQIKNYGILFIAIICVSKKATFLKHKSQFTFLQTQHKSLIYYLDDPFDIDSNFFAFFSICSILIVTPTSLYDDHYI